MAKKEYTNEEVTVVWQPGLCIHSANCVNSLGAVFDPNRKPWIDLSKADSDAIIIAVGKCPSSALSIKAGSTAVEDPEAIKVQLMPGGPLILKGICEVIDENGQHQKQKNVAFCRCTKSSNLPYCDGSHKH